MRWIERAAWVLVPAILLAVTGLRSAEEKRVTVYAARVDFSIPVHEREKNDYVALPEGVEPLGKVSVRVNGNQWRLRFNNVECEFKAGQTRGRVGRYSLDLTAPFVLEGERGYIPLHSFPVLLSRLLDSRVDFHTAARRILIGQVGTRFTVEVKKGEGMVLTFSEPVNPTISTEPGKLRMTFIHEPIVSDTGTFQFMDEKLTPVARFTEANGSAELTVQTNAPVLATFADGGKTIRIVPAPQQAAQTAPPAAEATASAPTLAPESAAGGQPATPAAAAGAAVAAGHPAYLVVVDASHGGAERGAALSDKLAEKDVTLALARKLRTELQARGIPTLMLRDSDATLTLEQRAETGNASRAAVYVSLHAANLGTGVRVYTAMLPAGTSRQQLFVTWETAQAAHTGASRTVANAVAAEIGKREMPSAVVAAPVRPLNNLTSAAIAVEVSLPGPQIETLNSPNYQQQVASAVATGIANARSQVEAVR